MLRIAFATFTLGISASSWGAEPVIDNERVTVWDTTQDLVVVWDYTWRPHEPTPMHFHDKDALVVFEETGALQSTTSDGKSTVNDYKFGDIRFNGRDRTHTELLIHGVQHAVITELK
jgi:hypothetical protein